MFFDQYYDLAELLNDTDSDTIELSKRWINWTYRDLCQIYAFPELEAAIITSADSWDFKRIAPIKTASTIDMISTDASDTAVTATVYGYSIASNVRTYQTENIALNGTATASSTNNFDFIDRIELAQTVGDVYVTDGTNVLATILAGETYVANDFVDIIKIDAGEDVLPITTRDRLMKFPGDANFDAKYYTLSGSSITFYNVSGSKTIYYKRKHPWLIGDYEESPIFVPEQSIVDAAWAGWGLRFEDEAGADNWKALYRQKLEDIIWAISDVDQESRFIRGQR